MGRPARALCTAACTVALVFAAWPVQAQKAAGPLGRHAELGPPLELPALYVDGRILVPVTVEGAGEHWFILDTAAGGSVISNRIRALLDPGADALRQDTVIGASGRTVMEFVALPGLRIAGRVHPETWAVVADISSFREDHDGRPVDGILGVDVLMDYDVEIDLPRQTIRLHPHGATPPAWARRRDALPFHSEAQPGFVQLTAAVAGTTVPAILDTGARGSILNWNAAGLAGVTPESDGLRVQREGSRGIDGKGMPSHRIHVRDLRVGDNPIRDRESKIADLPVFRALGLDHGPALIVGASLLEDCRAWIAYSSRQLRLCDPGPAVDPEPGLSTEQRGQPHRERGKERG